ncbi:hypothetical protein ACOME3_001110 [Neoechinorhynchus agilis]
MDPTIVSILLLVTVPLIYTEHKAGSSYRATPFLCEHTLSSKPITVREMYGRYMSLTLFPLVCYLVSLGFCIVSMTRSAFANQLYISDKRIHSTIFHRVLIMTSHIALNNFFFLFKTFENSLLRFRNGYDLSRNTSNWPNRLTYCGVPNLLLAACCNFSYPLPIVCFVLASGSQRRGWSRAAITNINRAYHSMVQRIVMHHHECTKQK